MKNPRKILAILLTLSMSLSLLPASALAANTEDSGGSQTAAPAADSLIQLAAPTDLAWGSYHSGDTQLTVPGTTSWAVADSTKNQGQFEVKVYRDGESDPVHTMGHDFGAGDAGPYSETTFLMSDPESGTYRFTVQTKADGTGYADSETVSSGTWTYTKPAAQLPEMPAPVWEDSSIRFQPGDSEQVFAYHVQYWRSDINDPSAGYQVGEATAGSFSTPGIFEDNDYLTYLIQNFGEGCYFCRIRSLSRDITQRRNGPWSDFSAAYDLGEISQTIQDQLAGIKDSMDYYSPAPAALEVRGLNTSELKSALAADQQEAPGGVTEMISYIESAVAGASGLTLAVEPKDGFSKIDTGNVSIVGALLNELDPGISKVTLEIGAPEAQHVLPAQYNNTVAVQFSMGLDGVKSQEALEVPVKITLPIPAGINPSYLVILHYAQNGSVEEVITPYIFQRGGAYYATIVLDHFSDFVMTQRASGTTGPGTTTSSGSSSSSDSGPSYSVKVPSVSHGSVTVSPQKATAGTAVTITVRPDSGYELDTLTVLNQGGREVRLTSKGSGQYTFTMPGSDAEIRVAFKQTGAVQASAFTDIPANYWAGAEIAWAQERGIMNGTGNGAFSPNGTVTRQQLWMVLARLSGSNPAGMAAARTWAMTNDISDGSAPTDPVTRQQMTTILYRFAQLMNRSTSGGVDLSTYPDSGAVSSYATDAMSWAVGSGIINGTSDGRLNPGATATRAQFAVILYRFAQNLGF